MTWQGRIIEKVAEKQAAVYPSVFFQMVRAHLHMPLEMIRLIDSAAQRRDVNRSTYMRRAIALLLAHDHDLPIRDVLRHSPSVGRYGKGQINLGQADDGTGIEFWCPHPGCDGSHLS